MPCVANRPDLFGHLSFEWSAFRALSTDRAAGMGIGPVPWSSIDRFARRYRIEGEEFDRFADLIQAMDTAYVAYHAKPSPQ